MQHRICNTAAVLVLGFLAGFLVACSGGTSPNLAADNSSTSAGSQQIPFSESKQLVLPADTMLYVRLQQSVMSASAKPGQTFTATLDEPLVADDQTTVAPQGTEVTGTVVAARDSGRVNTAGYVRVVISSMNLNGKTVPVQTASVIAGGANIHNRNLSFIGGHANSFQDTSHKSPAGFPAGQRLAFRLSQPLTF